MISADQCLPLLTYLYTEGKIFTNHGDHFYVVQAYISQASLHDHMECGSFSLFKWDHISATLGCNQDYAFDPMELELQQVLKATFCGDYNLLTPLVQYNFTTGHVRGCQPRIYSKWLKSGGRPLQSLRKQLQLLMMTR